MDMNFKPGDNDQNVLEKFGRNLNQEVKNNKVDPIIGRDNEIRRVIEIISRKNKNNPVLIGEPGVGKTAIVEGLAQKIVKGDVPSNLKDKVIFELSLPSLIAGASYQGQFEERINSVIKEVKKSNGNIILFIDEIHQLVGTGKTAGRSMDASKIEWFCHTDRIDRNILVDFIDGKERVIGSSWSYNLAMNLIA